MQLNWLDIGAIVGEVVVFSQSLSLLFSKIIIIYLFFTINLYKINFTPLRFDLMQIRSKPNLLAKALPIFSFISQ